MSTWRDTAGDLDLVVTCSGSTHRLIWSAGSIELPDHPDLAAERALIGLGGPEPACLSWLRLWNDAVNDGGFLAEWVDPTNLDEARLSWLGTALERMRLEGFHEFLRHLPPARAERMGHFVHRYPRSWLDRAACEVAEAVTGSGVSARGPVGCVHAPAMVEQAVANRLRRAFVASVGGRQLSWGAAALVPLHIRVDAVGVPSISGRLTGPGRGVHLTVAPTWLHQVWGAGAAVVDGHLVLALGEREDDRHDSVVAAWTPHHEPGSGAVATTETRMLAPRGDRWRLAPSGVTLW